MSNPTFHNHIWMDYGKNSLFLFLKSIIQNRASLPPNPEPVLLCLFNFIFIFYFIYLLFFSFYQCRVGHGGLFPNPMWQKAVYPFSSWKIKSYKRPLISIYIEINFGPSKFLDHGWNEVRPLVASGGVVNILIVGKKLRENPEKGSDFEKK